MYLAEVSTTQIAENSNAADEQYCSQRHQKFSEHEINSMPSWLVNAKKVIKTISKESLNNNINL